MDTDRLTPPARDAVEEAGAYARRFGMSPQPEHLLLALVIARRGGIAGDELHRAGVTAERVSKLIESLDTRSKGRVPSALEDIAALSVAEADRMGHSFVGTEHLLIGLLETLEPSNLSFVTDGELTASTVRSAIFGGSA